jgi:hypothetical protein
VFLFSVCAISDVLSKRFGKQRAGLVKQRARAQRDKRVLLAILREPYTSQKCSRCRHIAAVMLKQNLPVGVRGVLARYWKSQVRHEPVQCCGCNDKRQRDRHAGDNICELLCVAMHCADESKRPAYLSGPEPKLAAPKLGGGEGGAAAAAAGAAANVPGTG